MSDVIKADTVYRVRKIKRYLSLYQNFLKIFTRSSLKTRLGSGTTHYWKELLVETVWQNIVVNMLCRSAINSVLKQSERP